MALRLRTGSAEERARLFDTLEQLPADGDMLIEDGVDVQIARPRATGPGWSPSGSGPKNPIGGAAARQPSSELTPACTAHPWKGIRFRASWGSRAPLDVVLVEPSLVAEIVADTARDRGVRRHPVRFARLWLDVTVEDVPAFGAGDAPASS